MPTLTGMSVLRKRPQKLSRLPAGVRLGVAGPVGLLGALVAFAGCYEPPASGVFAVGPTAPPSPARSEVEPIDPSELPDGLSALRFAVAPVLGESGMHDEYGPLVEHLADVLGVPVILHVADSYGDLIDVIAAGRAELAVLPPASFVRARARSPGLQLLASQVAAGATSYSSYIVVRLDDPARRLEDLVGRRLVFVDELSASGFLVPYAAFLDQGIDPATAFASVHFARSHTAAVLDVVEGRADAAGTFSGMLGYATRKAEDLGPAAAEIRILHKAGRIPYDALCASARLPPAVAAKVERAVRALTARTAEGRRVYRATSNLVSGWSDAEHARYDALGRVIARVEAHRQAASAAPGAP